RRRRRKFQAPLRARSHQRSRYGHSPPRRCRLFARHRIRRRASHRPSDEAADAGLTVSQKNLLMKKLIECVPNFSEGRDQNVIRQITDAIESVDGVSLLDVDPGASTNRTVVTFVADPDAAVEAAFRGIRKAAE